MLNENNHIFVLNDRPNQKKIYIYIFKITAFKTMEI